MKTRTVIPYSKIALVCACMNCFSAVHAQQADDDPHDEEHLVLEEIVVTATPLETQALEMTQSATVLSGEALERQLSSSMGDTLKNLPGVSNASFGANVGRPVIRGMDASRVGVVQDNISSNDASKVSQDHAVTIEPFLADQIEVLRGPATLLYGSDTIGGVVNASINRIPQQPAEKLTGRFLIQGDSVADERYGAARIDGGSGNFGFHADGFYRDTSDYEIPGYAETDPEDGEEKPGTLANSAIKNKGGAIGGAWFGEVWQAGLSVSAYDSDYGIPGEGHHHEDEDHDDAEEAGAFVTIAMESTRVDGEILADNPWNGVERFKVLLNNTRYDHTEFEGDETGTEFGIDTTEGRLELTHSPLGLWRGVIGTQYSDRDFSAVGEEAFVPPSVTETWGVFLLEEADFDDVRVELGMRLEDIDTRTSDGRSASHSPLSASAGLVWHLQEDSHLAFHLSHAQRAPGAEELFSFGPHIATQSFEIGNPALDTESVNAFEVSYRKHSGPFTATLTFFHNDFDDYIYLVSTGEEEDELPVRQWTQQDATFLGGEAELRYDFSPNQSGHWQAWAFYDTVSAELADGSNVPRIPPRRFGLGLDWDRDQLSASLSWISASSQRDVAENETPTAAYNDLGFDLNYALQVGSETDWSVYLRARNLLDEDIRNSTSFLKDQAPQAGRNFIVGLRVSF